jgi:hypothetical protein
MVKMSMATLIRDRHLRGTADEGDRGGRKKGKPQRDVLGAAHAGCRRHQQEGRDATRAKELCRHRAVDIARSAQDAQQTHRHGQQDEARSGEQELSHGRSPG